MGSIENYARQWATREREDILLANGLMITIQEQINAAKEHTHKTSICRDPNIAKPMSYVTSLLSSLQTRPLKYPFYMKITLHRLLIATITLNLK